MAQKDNQASADKTRYSDKELLEFKKLIEGKLKESQKDLTYLQEQIKKLADVPESRGSSPEDGSNTQDKEYLNKMAARQVQYIKHLDNALIRIENKVYGICRVTKKLIQKERLMIVPHATLSIEAKNAR